jgi:hypothetical protein
MSTNNAFTPADRLRAQIRARRITVATGAGGLAALVAFAGLAAVSHPGSGAATTARATDQTTTQVTNDESQESNENDETTDDAFQLPIQLPTNASGGGQTTTGGS